MSMPPEAMSARALNQQQHYYRMKKYAEEKGLEVASKPAPEPELQSEPNPNPAPEEKK